MHFIHYIYIFIKQILCTITCSLLIRHYREFDCDVTFTHPKINAIMPYGKKIAQHSTKKFAPNFFLLYIQFSFNSHFDGEKKIQTKTTTTTASSSKYIYYKSVEYDYVFVLCNSFKPKIVRTEKKIKKKVCAGAYSRFHVSCCIPNFKKYIMIMVHNLWNLITKQRRKNHHKITEEISLFLYF